ncbi:MAG: hypothetical protein A3J09_02465 [Candidatus Zambryskibacteria bacterium RIFCSPLOWO2_02_FULL_51_21]|uniref:Uncharacterized protein n=1 Tax=Candidatus Zambryskibacteria bacterium RIFCSPHIGHO2_02_FULL_43_37 TaxID=1802749 RepID=A0A1G2TGD1_9BACT|nr:MAG: hypothetical protein A2723_02460 [Candidatus Zambryskibacteria bacterium RIFCSPHIGHO2_01_FULL_52_18]OHA96347.1 MAG: hypothetical protein A3D49_00435 [Candidatus Zambryskibacteria bacterium RIFCSPHIGHO2_02_FULL_43_37]OHB07749.1 MAG: hypothetical protein A2944_00305 [Candidatus Zambryskibacteria bacterium RIFCSPLOWO2_01_FULL_52_12]OHB11393.1 MAG: hypothetical protein A3J09_02465 [Candidatus Zambryskibacteria bacterium RIFCSPLOWO2_02_FULL_51_21]
MKKTLLISGAVIAILLLAFFAWFFLGRDKTVPAGEAVMNLLPFGSGENLGESGITNQESGIGITVGEEKIFDEQGVPTSNLFRLSDASVAGMIAFARGGQTVVRFVERATGHIYETALPKDKALAPLEKKKISINTLPKVYEAYFRPDGNMVLLRMLEDGSDAQKNLVLNLAATTSTAVNVRGVLGSIAVGQGNTLFYTELGSKTVVSSPFGGTVKTLYSFPFTDWRVSPAGTGLLLEAKPSAEAPGFAYILSAAGSLTRILGSLSGLSAVSNAAGTSVLYSYNNGSEIKLFARNLRTGAEVEISPATLAEKCVWSAKESSKVFCGAPNSSPSADEPDGWYAGATHFSDYIWTSDSITEISKLLASPLDEFGIDIDVYKPMLSPAEDYLLFINKRDMSLWVLKLPGA